MAATPLRQRLDRIRQEPSRPKPLADREPEQPAPDAGPAGAAAAAIDDAATDDNKLTRLEETLLGESGEHLPLKARLERLVSVAAARDRTRRPAPRPLEDMVVGHTVSNEQGDFFLAEAQIALDQLHGDVPLARLRAQTSATIGILAGEPGFESFDLARSVFLDTETTGLAGGTGTAAFLIGIGFVRDDAFVVRQYFMRDFHEEPALLHQLASDLAGFTEIVTFNGKMFDVPLLESRFRLNRARFPLSAATHLDLLFPARRLWKARLDSCRLVHLEAQLLRLTRSEDIPGEQIPQVYFDYVRSGDAKFLGRVFHHNRIDIVSLAALAALACQWVEEEGFAEDPRDVLSLARVLERADEQDRSEAEYRRALAVSGAASDVRRASLARLAARAKAAGDLEAAVEHWELAIEAGELGAYRELAVLHEHYRRDLSRALEVVEGGLGRLAERRDVPLHLTHDLSHRHERLLKRLARRAKGNHS